MEMEQHILESGQVLQTHTRTVCMGTWCCIHAPMPGPWMGWPRQWRDDRGIMERTCPHGVGHPVAEMYEPAIYLGREHLLLHGCCGCPCKPESLPEWGVQEGLVESLPVNPNFSKLRDEVGDLQIDVALYFPEDSSLGKRLQEFLTTVRKLTKE